MKNIRTEEKQKTIVARGEAIALHEAGRIREARAIYEKLLKQRGPDAELLRLLGTAEYQLGHPEKALRLLGQSIRLLPDDPVAHNNQGNALKALGRLADALASYDRAHALNPHYPLACNNRAVTLLELGRPDEALTSCERAVAEQPDYANAWNTRGNALRELRRFDDALASYERAIAINPNLADAYDNRGNLLSDLKRLPEAVVSYDLALMLDPGYAATHKHRGKALADLGRLEEALQSCDRALALDQADAEIWNYRGDILSRLWMPREALESYSRAYHLYRNLGNHLLLGQLIHERMKMCDWSACDAEAALLTNKIRMGEHASIPFPLVGLLADPSLLHQSVVSFARDFFPAQGSAGEGAPAGGTREKIRVGYFSADFHNHATAHLMAELFELHDTTRFELFAFSFGPNSHDAMRQRLVAAFDHFIDVRAKTDQEVARLSREMGIDIAVDLKGYTQDCRPGIFAWRAAPLQVNYLGFPGTMGAPYIDYLIADRTLVGEGDCPYYAEKIVWLPDSYQVNDRRRPQGETRMNRAELGLPEQGFIYCCFNNDWKITPPVFDSWMRILGQVEGSVLWLFADNRWAEENLGKEAAARGVDPRRLVFAPRLPQAAHLARQQLADLFLDTLPCNAHTTASDALWAGLPVLTCRGETFAGRVAASLLTAIEMPELITATQEDYEALAVALATDPQRLAQLKEKLARNRLTTPLFDTARFTPHLEAAYTAMFERQAAGLPPENIRISA